MSNDKTLATIKSKLQKIAQDIPAQVDQQATPPDSTPSSPQEVLSLVEEAIQILDTAAEGIPAEREGAGEPAAEPAMAKSKTAVVGKQKKAAQDEEDDDDDEDDDMNTAKLQSRIAALEKENTDIKRTKIAEDYSKLYPEDVRQTKFDEFVKSEETLDVLTAKFNAAKELSEVSSTQSKQTYSPAKNQSGYLNLKKASLDRIPEWRF